MKNAFSGKSLQFLNKDNIGQAKANAYNRCYLNAADLERETSNLSNFAGGPPGYVGLGDDFLSFAGDAGSFADPLHRGKLYTITLINANGGNTRIALLCPGLLYENAVGLVTDGAFNDTTGASGLSGSGTPLAIVYFNAFIRYYPTIVAGFKISTSNVTQFEQALTIFKQSPFSQEATRIINVGAYVDPINPNTTLVEVPESFYMDNQTVIQYPVLPSTSVSVMMFFGASLNIANALYNKAERAATNLSRLGMTPAGGGAVSNYRGRR